VRELIFILNYGVQFSQLSKHGTDVCRVIDDDPPAENVRHGISRPPFVVHSRPERLFLLDAAGSAPAVPISDRAKSRFKVRLGLLCKL
jgi:hypothetical protein